MTITVDIGLEWAERKFIGQEDTRIDAMAVGDGSAAEDPSNTSLDNRVSDIITDDNDPVRFVQQNDRFECLITVQGGSEIPTGTEIREVAVYAGANTGNPTMITRDVFETVTVSPGHSVEFMVPVDVRR